jgi:phosphohistidine phosphatase
MTERTLVLLRHAKADRPSGVADLDRPLSTRGHADAAAVGGWLARHGHRPDLVICSPAKRTRQTWHSVAVALNERAKQTTAVRYEDLVYDGAAADLLALARSADESVGTLLMVGHNPSISTVSAVLDPAAGGDSDGLRTSGLAVHRLTCSWSDLKAGGAPLAGTHTARG